MLFSTFCSLEDYVDFNIKIGLLPKDNRESEINSLYRSASEILSDMVNCENQSTYM